MDNKRGIVQPTLCVDNKKDKTEQKAMCYSDIKKKKKKNFFFGIFQIPFQVGNSANSATFPRSRKITGPTMATLTLRISALHFTDVVNPFFGRPRKNNKDVFILGQNLQNKMKHKATRISTFDRTKTSKYKKGIINKMH